MATEIANMPSSGSPDTYKDLQIKHVEELLCARAIVPVPSKPEVSELQVIISQKTFTGKLSLPLSKEVAGMPNSPKTRSIII